MAMEDERRTSARLQVNVEIGMQTESNFYTGLTQDLSGGGVFVATNQIRKIGERIKVLLTLPGQTETFEILAEVRWVRSTTFSQNVEDPGMGLRFLQMSPDHRPTRSSSTSGALSWPGARGWDRSMRV
jgi:type IV pilus assembly protein PilZ